MAAKDDYERTDCAEEENDASPPAGSNPGGSRGPGGGGPPHPLSPEGACAEEIPEVTQEDVIARLEKYPTGAEMRAAGDETMPLVKNLGFGPVAIHRAFITKEADETKRLSDQMKLCILLVERGGNITKAKATMGIDGRVAVEELARKYSIKNDGAGPQPREVVTLSRIGATYTLFCGLIANGPEHEPKIGNFVDSGVPKCMSLPLLAGVFPKNETGMKLLKLHQPFIKAFDVLTRMKPDPKAAIEYQSVLFNSPIGTTADKEAWCRSLGLINQLDLPTFTMEDVKKVLAEEYDSDDDDEN